MRRYRFWDNETKISFQDGKHPSLNSLSFSTDLENFIVKNSGLIEPDLDLKERY